MTTDALAQRPLAEADALRLLKASEAPLLALVQAAFTVRERHFGRRVRIHVLNNAQNGSCPEDCSYCAQAKNSRAPIERYRLKDDEQILAEAGRAHAAGAYRYCVVLSGRGPSARRVEWLAQLVRRIKTTYPPLEVCISAGLLDEAGAQVLKQAGLDRYNHNLNTSAERYAQICTTHGYSDRVATLQAARGAGIDVCSGLIIGMGEAPAEVVELAQTLRGLGARSIPVNFYVHVPGSALGPVDQLTPEYCLRVLCLFRLANPDAEIRAAGGREVNLRALEALALYPANSLFAEGYLNTGGHGADRTIALIRDAGFEVEREGFVVDGAGAAAAEELARGRCWPSNAAAT
ncbi:MAG: biotin synthase BioB [Proteobacteria bacterium]|nr:biotin synthase BioB [Pseudomonadota bacterium]